MTANKSKDVGIETPVPRSSKKRGQTYKFSSGKQKTAAVLKKKKRVEGDSIDRTVRTLMYEEVSEQGTESFRLERVEEDALEFETPRTGKSAAGRNQAVSSGPALEYSDAGSKDYNLGFRGGGKRKSCESALIESDEEVLVEVSRV